ncbi:unnamed protein product [Victoria cruziana]
MLSMCCSGASWCCSSVALQRSFGVAADLEVEHSWLNIRRVAAGRPTAAATSSSSFSFPSSACSICPACRSSFPATSSTVQQVEGHPPPFYSTTPPMLPGSSLPRELLQHLHRRRAVAYR